MRGGASSVLLHALERGVNIIDTARNYGESEAIVGRTLREWRGPRPFLATKVKPRDVTNWRFYVPMPEQFTRASIVDSVETSLRTLGVECIDLLQIHQWYYRWSHETEWLEALHALRAAGKIRFIGVSAQDHEHDGVLKLVDDRMVDAVQVVLNAFESQAARQRGPAGRGTRRRRDRALHLRPLRCACRRGDAESLAHDVKLANASPEIVTEYLARIAA